MACQFTPSRLALVKAKKLVLQRAPSAAYSLSMLGDRCVYLCSRKPPRLKSCQPKSKAQSVPSAARSRKLSWTRAAQSQRSTTHLATGWRSNRKSGERLICECLCQGRRCQGCRNCSWEGQKPLCAPRSWCSEDMMAWLTTFPETKRQRPRRTSRTRFAIAWGAMYTTSSSIFTYTASGSSRLWYSLTMRFVCGSAPSRGGPQVSSEKSLISKAPLPPSPATTRSRKSRSPRVCCQRARITRSTTPPLLRRSRPR
mmetsp:Transcript_92483/g.275860  ORF Transcript_92483/g.275860 Transcript_92483/m.275860 type:complete len:255 (-) Transcript_92483:150-914(-)